MHDPDDDAYEAAFLRSLLEHGDCETPMDVESWLTRFPNREAVIRDAWSDATGDPIDDRAAGDRRIGRYRILELVGSGGQGDVYRALDTDLGRHVALKRLSGLGLLSPTSLARFRREAEITSGLDHPGICSVYETGVHDGAPWIAMRFVEGRPLSNQIAESKGQSADRDSDSMFLELSEPATHAVGRGDEVGTSATTTPSATTAIDRDSIQQKIELIEKAARALHVAHEVGVVHRDVKPGNIMVTPTGEPVLLDFGLASVEEDGRPTITQSGELMGTPAYMSPEQIADPQTTLDRRTDVYSLGVTLYEWLTLQRPFDAPSREGLYKAILTQSPPDPRAINRWVSPELRIVLECALDKERDRRYQTAEALADDLRRVRRLEPIVARPMSRWLKTRRWAQRNPAVAVMLVVVFAAVTTAAGLLWFQKREVQDALSKERAAVVEKDAALADFNRMADVKRLQEAESTADELWPARPPKIAALEAWLAQYAGLANEAERHRRALAALESRAPPDSDEQADLWAWKRQVLAELVADLTRFTAERGTLASVQSRLERAREIERLTVTDHRADWDAAIARIAAHPRYGFAMKPQIGLVPLGPDPHSTLEELLHLDTHAGALPRRDADGRIEVTGETGVILVLIPAGRFWMGAQSDDPRGRNYDPDAQSEETLHEVAVPRAILLSKYEMTQGQWARSPAADARPSHYGTGFRALGRQAEVDDRHPVEQVSWDDCERALGRVGLALPSEEEWEYAARADGSTIWPGTSTLAEIPEHGNICGNETAGTGWTPEATLTDDWIVHAPVGRFRANGFGLHDLLGNVWEWTSTAPDPRSRIPRGGSLVVIARYARVAHRAGFVSTFRNDDLGVRPAEIVED